jgi:pimeloyl-ACP methyl ester carboxylesterase
MKTSKLSAVLVVMALALLLPYAGHARKSRGPLKPPVYPLTEKSVELLGTRVVYVEGGTGTPVIFVHGLGGALLDWEKVLPWFAERYHTIALDQPGFGKSEKRLDYHYSIENNAKILLALMDHLGLKKANLVGNSMGGEVVAYFAIHYPERVDKLALVDAAGALNLPFFPFVPELVWLFGGPIDSLSNRSGSNDPHTQDPDRVKPNIAQAIYNSDDWWGCRKAWRDELYDIFKLELKPDLRKISAPTLEIWGSKDPLLPFYSKWFFWENIPDCRLLIIPGGDHTSQLSKPKEFEAAIDMFLQGKPNPAYQKKGQKVKLD